MQRAFFLMPLLLFASCAKTDWKAHVLYGHHLHGQLVTRKQFGADWPYRMDSLYLFKGEKNDVYGEYNDTIYAINDIASDKVDSEEFGDFQRWHRVVPDPTKAQLAAWQKIEAIGMRQIVNELPRH